MDTLRAGTAPAIIRRKGAEGDLPVGLGEKIEILILLSGDKDDAIRNKAFQTLQNWKPEELQGLLSAGDTPWAVIDFLASYVVPGKPPLVDALLRNPAIPPDLIEWIKNAPASGPAPPPSPAQAAETPPGQSAEVEKKDPKRQTLLEKINAMSPMEKIKTALTGNQEQRMVLVRDGNKLVSRAVLGSPKLSDAEIESFASMKNVSEEILRLISMNRGFMKSYVVARALVNNPRAPLDVTLPLVNRLNDRDLKNLSMNKNVAETLRGMAAKQIKLKQDALKPKLPSKH